MAWGKKNATKKRSIGSGPIEPGNERAEREKERDRVVTGRRAVTRVR